ncbi:MAG: hypothetical protein Q8Q33_04985, partial [Chlamydiota bacterium]|nr:hypothetical protein [Chlamydiota bacterium]
MSILYVLLAVLARGTRFVVTTSGHVQTSLLHGLKAAIDHIPRGLVLMIISGAVFALMGSLAGVLVALCTLAVFMLALNVETFIGIISNTYGRIRQLAIQPGTSFRLGLEHGNIL